MGALGARASSSSIHSTLRPALEEGLHIHRGRTYPGLPFTTDNVDTKVDQVKLKALLLASCRGAHALSLH